MESNGPLARQRRSSPSSDRFLALFSQSPPPESSILGGFGDELSEDDIFWSGESSESNGSPSTSPAVPQPPNLHHLSSPAASIKGFGGPENFGILAALPEFGREKNSSGGSVLSNSTSISPSAAAAASARMIPVIPRPPPERTHSMSLKYHQSAPVNVPIMVRNDLDWRRRLAGSVLNGDDELGIMDDDEQEDGMMLPPHEMVAKQSTNSPVLSSSVLEGKGRTLKGRDLRRVRNAVFRQTGFID